LRLSVVDFLSRQFPREESEVLRAAGSRGRTGSLMCQKAVRLALGPVARKE